MKKHFLNDPNPQFCHLEHSPLYGYYNFRDIEEKERIEELAKRRVEGQEAAEFTRKYDQIKRVIGRDLPAEMIEALWKEVKEIPGDNL